MFCPEDRPPQNSTWCAGNLKRVLSGGVPSLFPDEATSALDETTEQRALENVTKASGNKAVVLSTHGPFVLKNASVFTG